VGFMHGDTSTNPYNRACTLIPLFQNSYCFLRCLKFVSQPEKRYLNFLITAKRQKRRNRKQKMHLE
jgi:hypothetical protein